MLHDEDTCADPYCASARPPAGAERAYGWYVVGEDVFCPLHGYGPALKAKRQAHFEQWKAAHKDEIDHREAARQAEKQTQSEQSKAIDAFIQRYSRSLPAAPTEFMPRNSGVYQ
jgi:hypothetical protein